MNVIPNWTKTALVLGIWLACLLAAPHAVLGQATHPDTPLDVETVHPHRGTIYRYINLPGEVHPYLRVTLFAKVDGYLFNLTVDKGDAVKAGQLLADIEVPELKANRLRYKAELELAQAEFDSVSEAATNSPSNPTPAELRAGKNKIALAKGRLATAKANLEYTDTMLNYARVTAPFDGIITKRYVDPGAYIPVPNAADTPEAAAIVDVTDFATLRMQVAVPEFEVRHIKLGQPVRWTTDALPGEVFDGTITRTYWALDRATKTMLTEVQMPNRDMMLRPGMLVNARIGLERRDNALLLPSDAVVKERLNSFVFLALDGNAKKAAVKTGFNDGTNVEILSGVDPASSVILIRDQPLRDALPVRSRSK